MATLRLNWLARGERAGCRRAPRGTARPPRPRLLALASFPALLLGLACGGDNLQRPPYTAEEQLYWALDLNHHAVTLSLRPPYDTLTLVATPRNVHGGPLADLPAPQYVARDGEHVQVTPDGVLHAVAVTDVPTAVLAKVTVGNLTHVDTVLVRVVDVDSASRPVLDSLSIHPLPPDSAKIASRGSNNPIAFGPAGFTNLRVRLVDTAGAPIPDPLVSLRVSDQSNAEFVPFFGQFRLFWPGKLTIYASATLFGVSRADTLPFRSGQQVYAMTNLGYVASASGTDSLAFVPADVKVGVGAIVAFAGSGRSSDTADVVFTDEMLPYVAPANSFAPAASGNDFGASLGLSILCSSSTDCATAGNIPLIVGQLGMPDVVRAARVFTRPGTYEFYSSRLGARGRVIVVDERE